MGIRENSDDPHRWKFSCKVGEPNDMDVDGSE